MTLKVEPTPGSLSTVDAAAHRLGQAAHDRQAEAGAAEAARGRAVGLHEGLEQPLALLLGEADAGVGDLDAERWPPAARSSDSRTEPCLGELERIAQQIEQDLLQPQRIADHALGHVGARHRRRA